MLFVGGSGSRAIAKPDLDLIGRQAQLRPAKWEDHLGLLAAVNRRAAERDRRLDPKDQGTVSPWCHAIYLSIDSAGAKGKAFNKPGEPPAPLGIDTILAGVDVTEMARLLAQKLRGEVPSTDESEDAIRRGIEGRP